MRNKLNQRIVILLKAITLLTILTACGATKTKVKAGRRVFLNLSLEFIGAYQLPKTTFKNTPVGGLSALTYDPQQKRFYAVSDDRSQARFYTLNPRITTTATGETVLEEIEVENVTFLTDEKGNPYSEGTVDREGIDLSSRFTLFISSEGVTKKGIAPFVGEFDLQTGKLQQSLAIPERYLPTAKAGVRDNLGFEALTLSPHSLTTTDPFRLFTATESALLQDNSEEDPEKLESREMLPSRPSPITPKVPPLASRTVSTLIRLR